ncbi:MAG: 50S ribosomal protein L10 [Bryobacterales bacterium]
MKTRSVKQAELDSLRQAFAENPVVVLCSFQGIKVDEDFQLRKKIRETGASYRVINNRLAKLASDGTPVAKAFEGLKGMTSSCSPMMTRSG